MTLGPRICSILYYYFSNFENPFNLVLNIFESQRHLGSSSNNSEMCNSKAYYRIWKCKLQSVLRNFNYKLM